MTAALIVFLGGGTGAVARLAVGVWLKPAAAAFPWPTFAVNVAGSFVLGVLAVLCRDRPPAYLLLGTGFCGGFTTFSTFSVEVVGLIDDGRPGSALGYAVGSVVAAVGGAWLGLALAGRAR